MVGGPMAPGAVRASLVGAHEGHPYVVDGTLNNFRFPYAAQLV